jgi:hypothetical protein
MGPVWVPDEAGLGIVKLTISFPGWKEGKVLPATYHLPLMPEDKDKD